VPVTFPFLSGRAAECRLIVNREKLWEKNELAAFSTLWASSKMTRRKGEAPRVVVSRAAEPQRKVSNRRWWLAMRIFADEARAWPSQRNSLPVAASQAQARVRLGAHLGPGFIRGIKRKVGAAAGLRGRPIPGWTAARVLLVEEPHLLQRLVQPVEAEVIAPAFHQHDFGPLRGPSFASGMSFSMSCCWRLMVFVETTTRSPLRAATLRPAPGTRVTSPLRFLPRRRRSRHC